MIARQPIRSSPILLGVALLSGGLLVAGCARHEAIGSGYAHPEWLVGADWVKQHRGDPAVRIVALTPPAEFAKSHIPGAAQIDAPALDLSDTSPAAVATWRAGVEKRLTTLGIRRNDTVVIYDGGTLFAARLWWVLDYLGHKDKRILDGGLPAWTAARDPIEQGQSVVRAAAMPYQGIPNPTALATLGEVKTDLGKVDVTLVDARSSQEYVKGHIPGAINVNYPLNAAKDAPRRWKSAADLERLYAQAGVHPNRRVIPYCSTGVRSAVTYFTLRLIGYPHVALYSGSWNEWSRHPGAPKNTGSAP